MFNPKIKDFLEENPKITLLGFFWAMYWRYTIIVLGASLVIAVLMSIFTALLGR
ncbi:MAG: hypothetical protein Q7S77_01840 [Candidatus Staskawiczbacteria bacterium]|nr:hypothetical protein [Candidatus Staskawiczbacteria bacterium]